MTDNTWKETIKGTSDQVLDAIRNALHEGNVRRITITHDGRTIAEFPLVVGLIGAVFAPVLAAVGALAAVLTDCTIVLEREKPEGPNTP